MASREAKTASKHPTSRRPTNTPSDKTSASEIQANHRERTAAVVCGSASAGLVLPRFEQPNSRTHGVKRPASHAVEHVTRKTHAPKNDRLSPVLWRFICLLRCGNAFCSSFLQSEKCFSCGELDRRFPHGQPETTEQSCLILQS
jgi:hypothetical protein